MQSHTCGVAGKKREDCFTPRRARAINLISLQPAAPKARPWCFFVRGSSSSRSRNLLRAKRQQTTRTPVGAEVGRTEQRDGFIRVPTTGAPSCARVRVSRATPRPREVSGRPAVSRDTSTDSWRLSVYTWDGVREWHASTRRETGSRSTNSSGSSSRLRTDSHNPDSRRECR